jgi:hypothetical protein
MWFFEGSEYRTMFRREFMWGPQELGRLQHIHQHKIKHGYLRKKTLITKPR